MTDKTGTPRVQAVIDKWPRSVHFEERERDLEELACTLELEVTKLRDEVERLTKERDGGWNEAISAAVRQCHELESSFARSGRAPGPVADISVSEGCAHCRVAIRALKRGGL